MQSWSLQLREDVAKPQRILTTATGLTQGLEGKSDEERLREVNLYSLEKAQGETRSESINTCSNRNEGRELFTVSDERRTKSNGLKQRKEKFVLGLV